MDLLGLTTKYSITTITTFIAKTDIKHPADTMPMAWNVEMKAKGENHHFVYTMGSGHCNYPKAMDGDSYLRALFYEARLRGDNTQFMKKKGSRSQIAVFLTKHSQPDPPTVDLLQALLFDTSSYYLEDTPGSFISEYGYSDIDEGLEAYKKCEEAFRFFIRIFSLVEFDELLQAGQTWND